MIRAKYIMCKRSAVKATTAGREVVFKLMATGCPGLPVVSEQLEVIGIITVSDILRIIKDGMDIDKTQADKIMSQNPVTAQMDTPLEELTDMMIDNNYTIIPIVKGKKLVGIVSRLEIIGTYVEPQLYSAFEE